MLKFFIKKTFLKFNLKFDLIFCVFGPRFSLFKPAILISGFAQPWIIYPDNEIFNKLSYFNKIKVRLKYIILWKFFKMSDTLIVELPHVKNRLIELFKFENKNIHVVENCVSPIFYNSDKWDHDMILPSFDGLKFGYIGRDYPHKNLNILEECHKLLKVKIDRPFKFYVTLNEQEWSKRSQYFRDNIHNIGVLDLNQCPIFYNHIDFVLFPSFLECYSATPIESIFMGKTLFASDRNFVKDKCGNLPIYFDPNNPLDLTNKIIENIDKVDTLLQGQNIKISNSLIRTNNYIKIINKHLKND